MNRELLAALVENVRRRAWEGDCPVTPAYPVETLENAIIDLAEVIEREQTEMSAFVSRPVPPQSAPAEQAGGDRIGTHSPSCWSFGPRHYECALNEINRLAALSPSPDAGLVQELVGALEPDLVERLARYLDADAFENRRRSSRNQHAANLSKTRARKTAKRVLRWKPIAQALASVRQSGGV